MNSREDTNLELLVQLKAALTLALQAVSTNIDLRGSAAPAPHLK